jgi:hypothetical protein
LQLSSEKTVSNLAFKMLLAPLHRGHFFANNEAGIKVGLYKLNQVDP